METDRAAETLFVLSLMATGRCNPSCEGTGICQLSAIRSTVSGISALKQGNETVEAAAMQETLQSILRLMRDVKLSRGNLPFSN